jgi:hypothetical protein
VKHDPELTHLLLRNLRDGGFDSEIAQYPSGQVLDQKLRLIDEGLASGAKIKDGPNVRWIKAFKITTQGHEWLEARDSINGRSERVQAQGSEKLIFVSHSSLDEDLVIAVTDLLKAAFRLPAKQILCTSVPGHKLAGGANTEQELLLTLRSMRLLIGVLTPTSLASSCVLFEIGAAWGLGRPLVSLVAKGLKMADLQEPLKSRNALDASEQADVQQFVEDISKLIGAETESPSSYFPYVERLVKVAKAVPLLHTSRFKTQPQKQPPLAIPWESLVDHIIVQVVAQPGMLPSLYSFAKRRGLKPYEDLTSRVHKQVPVHCAGLSCTERSQWLDTYTGRTEEPGKAQYEFVLEPNLLSATAPLIDRWRTALADKSAATVELRFHYGLEMEWEQYRLNASIHNTELHPTGKGEFIFRKYYFELGARSNGGTPQFLMRVRKKLSVIPWQDLFSLLLTTKVFAILPVLSKQIRSRELTNS